MHIQRLSAHLSGWGHAHEDTAEGWIAHGFAEGLDLARQHAGRNYPGSSGLWTDEAKEYIRVGCAAAGDPLCSAVYREALEAGYRIGKGMIDDRNCTQNGGE
jgi:hypothetical protein